MSEVGGPATEAADLPRIVALLSATPWLVASEIGALGSLVAWRPAPGEWCANEIVGHLVEAERRGFAGRIEAMLRTERPALETWDQPEVAAARHDCERPAEDLLHEFIGERERSVELLRSLGPDDLGRAGSHPVVGVLTVGEVVAEWVHHDREHLDQLLDVARAWAWARMGNARRFGVREP